MRALEVYVFSRSFINLDRSNQPTNPPNRPTDRPTVRPTIQPTDKHEFFLKLHSSNQMHAYLYLCISVTKIWGVLKNEGWHSPDLFKLSRRLLSV